MSYRRFSLTLLILASLLTRIVGINWGDGKFLHPDENNMARSLSSLSIKDMDPHFYAYGQLPVYLGYFILSVLRIPNSFENSIYVLRFISIISSLLGIFIFYKLCQKIDSKSAIISTFLFIFLPGTIQLSHFGTTESILMLFYLLIFYFCEKKTGLASVFLGLAIGIKISSLIFIIPILLSNLRHKKFIKTILNIITILIFAFISSPYSLINNSDFISSLRYESDVALGTLQVFYTNQFIDTTPYLFQIQRIFPFALGVPVFILFFFSITRVRIKKDFLLLTIAFTSLIYFIYFGQLYAKWFRFMSPIFFIFPLYCGLFLGQMKNRFKMLFTLIVCVLPGIYFFTRYISPDPRTLANNYIASVTGPVLSEAGNVINFDNTNNFDFYNLDSSSQLQRELQREVAKSKFIVVPSRRIFANQNTSRFPYSQEYYKQLFKGSLGFSRVASFSFYPEFLDPELHAEETFTVFDSPKIRIYKKNEI